MNRIAKIAALLVALTAVFSFSQESSSVTEEKPIVYDTVRRVVSDSVTVEALTKSQEFYSNSFHWLLGMLAIAVAVLAYLNTRSERNLGEKIKNQLNLFKEDLEKEIIKKLNEEIAENFKKYRKEDESKFNGAYKKIAELFYISARDELPKINESKDEKDKNDHWFYHFMSLAGFYYALKRMSKLSNNEIHFIRFVKKFTDEYHKCTLMPNVKFFHHFLPFIEYSENINGIIFEETKIIYNKLLKIFDYNKITEYIGKSEFGEEKERDQKLLTLAKRYKDKEYLEIFNFDKLQEGTQNASENKSKS